MADGRRGAALDLFRLAAVMLVVANHTSPLVSVSPLWDFWFTRVLARVAVPFFLMVSGYFLAKDQWRRTGVFLKKTCLLYGAAVLLYLPLNWYNGGYGPAEWVKKLLLDGTFYHLWYFPGVILGVLVARGLLRLGSRTALTAAGLLYLVGPGRRQLLWTDPASSRRWRRCTGRFSKSLPIRGTDCFSRRYFCCWEPPVCGGA